MYSDNMPPELRSYLEGILDDASAQTGITINHQNTRERVLWKLLKELDTFVFLRIRAALPPSELTQFHALLEQGVTEEDLQAITTRSIPNLQAFAQGILVDFRARYVKPSEQITRSVHVPTAVVSGGKIGREADFPC
jgi:hypothetical protein